MFRTDDNAIKRIEFLEKRFSCFQYYGIGIKPYVIKCGSIPVMISAPHSVNHYREGKLKRADKMTGGIVRYLHEITGCHIMYATRYSLRDPNYDDNPTGEENLYQRELTNYIKANNIRVLIDLHGVKKGTEYGLEIGTAPEQGQEDPSLQGYDFIWDLVRYTFEYTLQNIDSHISKAILKNKIFSAGKQNTITKYVYKHTQAACFQLEVNGDLRDPSDSLSFQYLMDGLVYLVTILGKVDWCANRIKTYKLWQSAKFKPQDRVGFVYDDRIPFYFEGSSLLQITSINGSPQLVRPEIATPKSLSRLYEIMNCDSNSTNTSDYVFLTNRLIEQTCGRSWGPKAKGDLFLYNFPIVISDASRERYEIGLPSADKIDNIYLSYILYKKKMKSSDSYDYLIFNRYTGTRFYIDLPNADYGDNGALDEERILIPRYHKRLLGYLERPFTRIREEEFAYIKDELKVIINSLFKNLYIRDSDKNYTLSEQKIVSNGNNKVYNIIKEVYSLPNLISSEDYNSQINSVTDAVFSHFSSCYEKMEGEAFYEIREELCQNRDKQLIYASNILDLFDAYKTIELLQIPRIKGGQELMFVRIQKFLIKSISLFRKILLERFVKKSEFLLKTNWTSETDDNNGVARLSPNMMSLLGVIENDKIQVQYGGQKEVLRVLSNEKQEDFLIGIPAPTRKKLGMNSINDIVSVNRDMKHVLQRNSQAQTIALLGTLLALLQIDFNKLFNAIGISDLGALCIKFVVGLILCVVILWVVLYEERIKVK